LPLSAARWYSREGIWPGAQQLGGAGNTRDGIIAEIREDHFWRTYLLARKRGKLFKCQSNWAFCWLERKNTFFPRA